MFNNTQIYFVIFVVTFLLYSFRTVFVLTMSCTHNSFLMYYNNCSILSMHVRMYACMYVYKLNLFHIIVFIVIANLRIH